MTSDKRTQVAGPGQNPDHGSEQIDPLLKRVKLSAEEAATAFWTERVEVCEKFRREFERRNPGLIIYVDP
ncbi:MAG: hypothetical protein VYA17_07400 [Pseudomonadota bacterium]|nr:hypothetical protein [Pseudomonadota bacterium]